MVLLVLRVPASVFAYSSLITPLLKDSMLDENGSQMLALIWH